MNHQLTTEFLLLKLSLYEKISFEDEDLQFLDRFVSKYDMEQFDGYCVDCQKDSTFKKAVLNRIPEAKAFLSSSPTPLITLEERLFKNIQGEHNLNYKCQRNENHRYHFYFKIESNELTKIGQYPSVADLELHKIKRYRSLLKDDYRDFSKAIGLYSHGIGAGSYVYLRRIFENLINQQKDIALKSDTSLSEIVFNKGRMDDKILYIKDFLPDLLVQNRNIYGILSKGIHELSESQCLDMFPKLELGIEIILDWKLAEKEKQEKESRFSKFVSETFGKLKS
ncbi:hypothetical protein M3638_02985 [Oceanobacillus profundus]|uniref:hypothetical protein n=1 Tax=Oceanobacillus profundus TaxID=372463 RepID=UPI00203BC99C|nr:hypothetical protein [Oceanobacillus profundus]MCM3396804.1 hypothetical protein [Oceanobacillus profundus]